MSSKFDKERLKRHSETLPTELLASIKTRTKKPQKKRVKCGTLSSIFVLQSHSGACEPKCPTRLQHLQAVPLWALVAVCSWKGDNREAGPMYNLRRITYTFEDFENILVFNQKPCQWEHQRWTVRRANTVQLLLEWKSGSALIFIWWGDVKSTKLI